MPSAQEIMDGLQYLALNYMPLAIIWHLILAAFIIAIFMKWRPSNKAAAALLIVPMISVSAMAWLHENPFNGLIFLLSSVILLFFGLRAGSFRVHGSGKLFTSAGILALMFGLFYPHFLETQPWYFYLFAAPTGLIPCPTLSTVIGIGLLAGGFESRGWSLTLAITGLFYGLFGMFRLGVWLDAGLVAAALILFIMAFKIKPAQQSLR